VRSLCPGFVSPPISPIGPNEPDRGARADRRQAYKAVDELVKTTASRRRVVAVANTRGQIGKTSMIHNGATPKIDI
jgi:hypothetical protein